MAAPDVNNDMILIARTRARIYAMLAAAFDYPTPDFYVVLESGAYADGLTDMIGALYPDLADQMAGPAVTLCAATSLSDQQSDYLRTFETGMPKPPVQLYEGLGVRPTERASILLELKAFFRQFGLTMNKSLREFEDSVTAELEFMQFLAMKEVDALENGWDCGPYRHAQHDFLVRHLGKWLPKLAKSASEVQSSFYRSVAQIAAMFVERDEIAILRDLSSDAALAADLIPST